MKIVIEILEGDGYDVIAEQLRWMEGDRRAEGGYLTLDGNNCVLDVRIAGVARDVDIPEPGDLPMVFVEPLEA